MNPQNDGVYAVMRLSTIAVTLVIAAVLLLVADRIFQPVPIPAGVAVLGGLLAVWSRRRPRASWVAGGLIVGGVIGAGVHAYVHLTGRSTPPEEGVLAHVAVDGTLGIAVGAAVLAVVALVARMLPSRVSVKGVSK